MPLATAGGAKIRVDGSLRLGSWEPDLTFDVTAGDLAEVERIAAIWYPAIQKAPLEPPLLLGGSGHVSARLTRAFGDPHVEGRIDATDFVLRGVRFGELVVDHNVATFARIRARRGGSFSLEGRLGFGSALQPLPLDSLVRTFAEWPIERDLAFSTSRSPRKAPAADGVTPLHGRDPAVLTDATVWNQARPARGRHLRTTARERRRPARRRDGGVPGTYRYANGATRSTST